MGSTCSAALQCSPFILPQQRHFVPVPVQQGQDGHLTSSSTWRQKVRRAERTKLPVSAPHRFTTDRSVHPTQGLSAPTVHHTTVSGFVSPPSWSGCSIHKDQQQLLQLGRLDLWGQQHRRCPQLHCTVQGHGPVTFQPVVIQA